VVNVESPSSYVVSKEAMGFLNVLLSSKPIKDEKAIIDAFKKGFVSNAILSISPDKLIGFEGIMKRYLDADLVDNEYYKTVELGIIAIVITLLARRLSLIASQGSTELLDKYLSYISSLRFKSNKKDVIPLLALSLVTEEGKGFYKVTGLALYLLNFLLSIKAYNALPKAYLKDFIEDLNKILLFHKFLAERVTSLIYEAPSSLYQAYHGSSKYNELMAELDYQSMINTMKSLGEKLAPPYRYEIPMVRAERRVF
jgi:hypothetical protein